MKKNTPNTDKKDKLDPMKDTRNYAAGREGEDIVEGEEEEIEEEPLDDELILTEEELEEDEEDDDDDDRA